MRMCLPPPHHLTCTAPHHDQHPAVGCPIGSLPGGHRGDAPVPRAGPGPLLTRQAWGHRRRQRAGETPSSLTCTWLALISSFAPLPGTQVTHFDLDVSHGRIRRGVTHSGHSASAPTASRGTSQLAMRQEGRLLAGATWDGRVRLWDAKARVPLASLRFHTAAAACVAWANDAHGTLASGGRDGLVALWRGLYPREKT